MQPITVRFRRNFDARNFASFFRITLQNFSKKAKTADIETENSEGKRTAFFVVRIFQDMHRLTGSAWRRLKFGLKLKKLKRQGYLNVVLVYDKRYGRNFEKFDCRVFTTEANMCAADIVGIARGRI